jgi:DNA uptake protein ComE-like DNA-binding protein
MTRIRVVAVALLLVGLLAGTASAQVGSGLQDLNAVPEATLATMPNMTPAIAKAFFVHLNLNTATAAQILLVPRIASRMTREFEEYRPWVNFAQFDREIGKYVDAAEVARLRQYVFIPLNLNTATADQFKTIPQLGNTMVREFNEYRPWKTQAQFEKEIGKYVDAKEVARLWRFMTIVP